MLKVVKKIHIKFSYKLHEFRSFCHVIFYDNNNLHRLVGRHRYPGINKIFFLNESVTTLPNETQKFNKI